MLKIGVVGLGMMGSTHLDVYRKRTDVRVVAVADLDQQRRCGKATAAGNIEGQSQGGFDFSTVKQYADGRDLIADPDVDVVDLCLPTPAHSAFGSLALEAGKHLIIEKPLARTYAEAIRLAQQAEQSKGLSFCAMCMRFWPGWDWLKEAVDSRRYGAVQAVSLRRVTQFPGGPFYSDGQASGGALLDLHIHDSDFVRFLFGMPKAVSSRGYSRHTSHIDHVLTQYHYDDIPIVSAEGSWAMSPGFGFEMEYHVNFEQATASFRLAETPQVELTTPDEGKQSIPLSEALGYELELAHFIDCIKQGVPSDRISLFDAAESVRLIEAEAESCQSGRTARIESSQPAAVS
ncbi:MAG: Gfo/Idh/MocA family protein [Blastopirellula sp. JB062]